MTGLTRVGGRARLTDGRQMVWSVADGRLGRRWRVVATSTDGDAGQTAALLEVDVTGRVARLELSSPSGLLTLHPEASGGLQGNVVGPSGVQHLSFGWSDAHELVIEGFPVTAAISARRLAATTPVGEGREIPIVAVGRDLSVVEVHRRFERVADAVWRISNGDHSESIRIDDRGIPDWGGGAVEWPLELEPQP